MNQYPEEKEFITKNINQKCHLEDSVRDEILCLVKYRCGEATVLDVLSIDVERKDEYSYIATIWATEYESHNNFYDNLFARQHEVIVEETEYDIVIDIQ